MKKLFTMVFMFSLMVNMLYPQQTKRNNLIGIAK